MDPFTLVIIGVVTSAFCTGAILGISYEIAGYRKRMKDGLVRVEAVNVDLQDKYKFLDHKIDAQGDRVQVIEMKTQVRG